MDRFAESMYEHSDVVVAIECISLGTTKDQQMDDNQEPKQSTLLMLSVSRDGYLFLWTIDKNEAYKASKWNPSDTANDKEESSFEILNF